MFCGVGKIGQRSGRTLRRLARGHAASAAISALWLALAVACGNGRTEGAPSGRTSAQVGAPIEITDDAGQPVHLDRPARRVVSLMPSATETLLAIGAGPQLIARTRYDVAPEVAALPSVGGGVDPSVEAIVGLHPDLVIAWESDKRQVIRQKLLALGIPVFVMRTQDTTDIFRGIATIGRLTGHDSAATAVATSVRDTLESIARAAAGRPIPSVFYVVYNNPPMTAGPHTFINQLISLAGGRSIFADASQQWPSVAMEEIVRRDPDILIVPEGEFTSNSLDRFNELAGWRSLRAVREGRVVGVSADLMSRPSPSIARAARVLFTAFHPEGDAPAPEGARR